jgi:hypothetical protein
LVKVLATAAVPIDFGIWEIRMITRRFTVFHAPRGRFKRGAA